MTKTDFDSKYSPIVMPEPFAESGDKSTPANTQDDASGFSFPLGFNSDYSSPSSNNGKFVTRAQMNAIGNLATHNDFHRRCGGINTFDLAFAEKIGGYPRGAVLQYLVGRRMYHVISNIDNNTINFTDVNIGVDGTSWSFVNIDIADDIPGTVTSKSIDVFSLSGNYPAATSVINLGLWQCPYVGTAIFTPGKLSIGANSNTNTVHFGLNAPTSEVYDGYFPLGVYIFMKDLGATSNLSNVSIDLPKFNKSNGKITLNGYKSITTPSTTPEVFHVRGGYYEGDHRPISIDTSVQTTTPTVELISNHLYSFALLSGASGYSGPANGSSVASYAQYTFSGHNINGSISFTISLI